jgi:NtrC-family two-component system response regulator AlgB
VRIITATNRDLKKRVAEGTFREDLYFRLNVIAVEMPPLRERRDDLLRFAEHYAKHFGAQCDRKVEGFTDEALACLNAYPWPGNLREMRNAIERAVILARRERIGPEVFPAEMRLQNIAATNSDIVVGALTSLDKLEELHIRKVLDRVPNLSEAAQVLGIDQATLYRKRKKLGLE